MRVVDDTLRVRSNRAALRYLGADAPALKDADGFVDTGDVVARRGDRYLFIGRRGGVINVGGAKVHPEEVEAVLNALRRCARAAYSPQEPDHRRARRRRNRAARRRGRRRGTEARHHAPAAPRCRPTWRRRWSASSPNCRSPTGESWAAMDNVLVTGASRGIGVAIATRLARDGLHVIGVARKPSEAFARAAAELAAPARCISIVDSPTSPRFPPSCAAA